MCSFAVEMHVFTDKKVYGFEDVIQVRYVFINKSDKPVFMLGDNTCFYNSFFDVPTGDPLRRTSYPCSSSAYTPYESLILLLQGDGFQNLLEIKFRRAEDGKVVLMKGDADAYWVKSKEVLLEGRYIKDSELNEEVFKDCGLPIYAGVDLKSHVQFRIDDHKIYVERIANMGEEQSGGCWNDLERTIKASYLLSSFGEESVLSEGEVYELFGMETEKGAVLE
jgi:hypothetical protein